MTNVFNRDKQNYFSYADYLFYLLIKAEEISIDVVTLIPMLGRARKPNSRSVYKIIEILVAQLSIEMCEF